MLIKNDFVIDKIAGEVSIFDSINSLLYTFNGPGSFIFEKLKKGFDTNSIAMLMSKKYQIPLKQAVNDVSDFLKYLLKNKIIFPLKQKKTNK